MASLVEFLRRLLDDGEVIFTERPRPGSDEEARAYLERAYVDYRLEIAGPLLAFDAKTAVAASQLVWHACWFLVNHDEPNTELEKHLTLPAPPTTAAQHLSADLVLRYLPHVYRRAHALAPDDLLSALLAKVLRQWPLTGVLADVREEPLTPLDFGGHPGLMLLYAERLAQHEKTAWFPTGAALEYVEWVFQEQGKERSVQLHKERLACPVSVSVKGEDVRE
jgi:hypothetical protein